MAVAATEPGEVVVPVAAEAALPEAMEKAADAEDAVAAREATEMLLPGLRMPGKEYAMPPAKAFS